MRRLHLTLRLGLAVALVATACATASLYQMKLKPYELQGSDFALPSGLRVFFQEDHNQSSVIVVATVGVGSTAEPPGKEGMAHLIEHLNFRAKHGDKPKVMDHLKMLGAWFNAFTTTDDTTYFSIVARDELPTLLEIEARRLQNPLEGLTQEILDTEREVVRNELRQSGETRIDGKTFDTLDEMLFPAGHPYHRSVIGTHESLLSITIEDLQRFVAQHYRPDNTTIVVAGDFDRAKAGEILARAFPRPLLAAPGNTEGPLGLVEPKPRIKGEAPPLPPPADRTRRRIQGPVEDTTVYLAWSLPGAYRDDDWKMQLAAVTLTNAVASLLLPDSIYEEEKVEDMGCFAIGGVHATRAICAITVADGEDPEEIAKKAIDGLWEQWDQATWKLRKRNIGLARSYLMTSLFDQSASILRAVEIARTMHWTAHPDVFSRSFVELGRIKELELRDFAFNLLNRDRVVSLIVEPRDKDQVQAVTFDVSAGYSGTVLEVKDPLEGAFAKLPPADLRRVAVAPSMDDFRQLTLPSGLRAIVKRHGDAPFVNVALVMGGGSLASQPPGVDAFVRTEHDAKDPMRVAGQWWGQGGRDLRLLAVNAPSGNLEAALDLLATRVETVRVDFDPAVYKRRLDREERLQRVAARGPRHRLEVELVRRLWPGHPLGQIDVDVNALRGLGEVDFASWIQRTYAPANATLMIVGDVDLATVEQQLTARFADWRVKAPGTPVPPLPPRREAPSRQILLVDRPDATQSQIQIACPLDPLTEDNQAARQVALAFMQEDLWRQVREQAGASYGIHLSADDLRGGAADLRIASDVQTDQTVAVIRAVIAEIERVSRGELGLGRLRKVQWNLARETHVANLGLAGMLATLVGAWRSGLSVDAVTSFPRRLAAVTPASAGQVLALCKGHEVIGVVGPAAVLEPALGATGWPVYRLADAP